MKEEMTERIQTDEVKAIGVEVDATLKHTKRWGIFA